MFTARQGWKIHHKRNWLTTNFAICDIKKWPIKTHESHSVFMTFLILLWYTILFKNSIWENRIISVIHFHIKKVHFPTPYVPPPLSSFLCSFHTVHHMFQFHSWLCYYDNDQMHFIFHLLSDVTDRWRWSTTFCISIP